jgi:mannose-6-phosphate isomerase-like protein (cupin superfamily)
MADGYTHVNLRADVENSAEKFGLAPDLAAHFATGDLGLEKSAISYQRLEPKKRMPFGHKHKQQEELYVVVGGSARAKIDDDVVELKAWDAVRVPNEKMRCLEAGPEGAEILAFGAPNTGPSLASDTEMTPNWWTD